MANVKVQEIARKNGLKEVELIDFINTSDKYKSEVAWEFSSMMIDENLIPDMLENFRNNYRGIIYSKNFSIGNCGFATFLKWLSIIGAVCCLILGVLLSYHEYETYDGTYVYFSEFNLIIWWIAGFSSGITLYGFSRIIEFLYEINQRLALANERVRASEK